VLRPGGVTREELQELLGMPVELARDRAPGSLPLVAPGQLERHYATRTPLRLLSGPASAPGRPRVGLLAFTGAPGSGFAAVEVLAPDGKPATAAANLFAALRRLDARGLDMLLAEPCSEEGLGSAIMDRLRRCAAGAV
jgi:L-threonylcarbamoyladenylate synthase